MKTKCLIGLFLLCAVLSGCVSTNRVAIRKDNEGVYGYRLKNVSVIFEFDRANYEYVTSDESGVFAKIEDVNIRQVCVAGEFNSWARDKWIMQKVGKDRFRFEKRVSEFGSKPEWQFKFVINGSYWVEPPTDAVNRIPTGFMNNSFNLVLRLKGLST